MQANRVLGLFALLILLAGAAIGASLYFGHTAVVVSPDAATGGHDGAAPESGAVSATGAVEQAGGDSAVREAVTAAGAADGAPALVGQVVGEDGQPLADAEVLCLPGQGFGFDVPTFDPSAEDSFDPQAMAERERARQQQQVGVRTDAEGRFRLAAPGTAGRLSVRVMARGYQALQRQTARPQTADVDLGVLTVQLGAVVSGRVLDPRGNPIASARVVRMQQFEANFGNFDVQMPGMDVWENARGGDSTVTDEQGRFELPHLAAGEFSLRARHPDHPSARSEALNVPKGRSVEGVLITMQPGADIRGVVLNIPEGVENVRVMASARRDPQGNGNQAGIGVFNVLGGDPGELLGDMGMPFGERQVDPDREGRFVLRGLEQGLTYRLWAVQQGRGIVGGGQCTERLEVRSGTSNVELHYEAGVTVTFTVLGKGDAPVERLWVRDRLRGGNNGGFGDMMWGGFGGGRGRAQDYPGGKVTLANLRPKQGQKLQLDVDALGYLGWQKADIELPAVGALDLGPVHLSPTPLLEVEVLAADTGAPIEGARVRLSSQPREGRGGGRNPFAGWQGAGGQGPSSATTDAAGLAAVNASVDDPATLRVTAKDFASVRLDLPPNTSGAQQIKLLVGGTIEVSVLDPQQQPVANVTVEHRGADGETGEARTDEHGVARFAHQVPGEHEVRLAQDRGPMRFAMRIEGMPQAGGEAAEEPWTPVTVADKATVALTLAKAPTAKVEGVVRENGLALSGARVVFVEGPGAAAEGPEAAAFGMVQGMMEQFGQGGSKSARSGDDGTFKLAELPAGQHRLRITHKDRAMPTEIPVVLREGDNRVDVELDMTSVRGVVRDPDGNPVSGARVGAKVVSGDNQPDVGVIVESMAPGLNLGGGGGTQRTDANGEFELRGVEPGATLQVRAAARGFAPAVVTTSVARGESKVGVDLRLGAAGKIAVTVAGTPGPFSMVQARRVGKDGPEGQPSVQMLRRGKGTISDLEPGLYEVEYRSAQDLNPQNGLDGGQRKRVEVVAGETATVEF